MPARIFWTLDLLMSKTEPSGGCLLWTGPVYRKTGYGAIKSRTMKLHTTAHRLAWALRHGPIPDGLCVLHRCDVRRCIRDEHLFLGTIADNQRDMSEKGRSYRGERHWKRKATEGLVREIRGAWTSGNYSSKAELAKRYRPLSYRAIICILSGENWGHVR